MFVAVSGVDSEVEVTDEEDGVMKLVTKELAVEEEDTEAVTGLISVLLVPLEGGV